MWILLMESNHFALEAFRRKGGRRVLTADLSEPFLKGTISVRWTLTDSNRQIITWGGSLNDRSPVCPCFRQKNKPWKNCRNYITIRKETNNNSWQWLQRESNPHLNLERVVSWPVRLWSLAGRMTHGMDWTFQFILWLQYAPARTKWANGVYRL